MGPNDVVLEEPGGGMPPAAAQTLPTPPAAPPQQTQTPQRPAPDLSQPLLDDDTALDAGAEDENELPDDAQPQGRRSLVGELVRTREQARIHREQSEQSQQLLRQVLSLPGGAELLQAAVTGRPPGAGAPGAVSPQEQQEREQLFREAQEVAQDLGLYDGEGKPDVRLAAKIVLRDRKRVQDAVQAAVQPLQQRTLQLGAEPVIQHVLGVAEQFGISPELVEQGLRATPASELGKPEVQQAVLMMALGTQQMLLQQNAEVPGFGYDAAGNYVLLPRTVARQGQPMRQPAVRARQGVTVPGVVPQRGAARPPLFMEQPGGRPRTQQPGLDPVFRERLQSTGMKDADIDSALGNFVPGAPNRLE